MVNLEIFSINNSTAKIYSSLELNSGGVYVGIGGSTIGITFGSGGIVIIGGGQVSVGVVVSGSTTITWNDGEWTVGGQTGIGVGTPTGMPGISISWTTDPSSGEQTIQVGVGFNDIAEAGGQISFTGELPNGDPYSGDPSTGMPWPGLIGGIQDAIGNAQAQGRDPLILDLDGDGIETTVLSKSMTSGVHFNLDGTGFAENTSWVGHDDGLLVSDLNGDGKITDGSELFGNYTLLKNGNKAANGFEALKDLDDNNDGVVDSQDSAFSTLRVWKDLNSDGITEDGELLTLAQAGVQSLSVGYTNLGTSATADAQGNQHQQLGSFTKTDGSTQKMNDVWFSVNTARTVDLNTVAVSAEIAALPDVAGMGNLKSLRQASNDSAWRILA